MAALEFALLSLITLLTMINPISIMPVFVTMTSDQTRSQSRRFALRASLSALVILIMFAVIGKLIFALFAISLESLRIVGGILFFVVGHEMLTGKTTQRKNREAAEDESGDQSITPLGVPLICGPGAISTVMLLMNECHSLTHKALLIVAIVIVSLVTFLSLISARKVMRLIGETGINVLMRITGLIVMAIAVEFFVGGVVGIVGKM